MFLLKSHPFNAFFSAFSSRSLREGKKMHLLIRVFFYNYTIIICRYVYCKKEINAL